MSDEKLTPCTSPLSLLQLQLPPLFISFTSHTSCDISLLICLPNPQKYKAGHVSTRFRSVINTGCITKNSAWFDVVSHLIERTPVLNGTRKFIVAFTRPSHGSYINQKNPIHPLTAYFLNFILIFRVIHTSLRDFRTLRYSSRDDHAELEHVNRGRDTPTFCPTL